MILVVKIVFAVTLFICALRLFGNLMKSILKLLWKYSPLIMIIIAISWMINFQSNNEVEYNDITKERDPISVEI